MQGSEELFSIDPLPGRSVSLDVQAPSGSAFATRPHTPIPSSNRTDRIHEQVEEELVAAEGEVVQRNACILSSYNLLPHYFSVSLFVYGSK